MADKNQSCEVEIETEELQTKDGTLRDLTIKINVDVSDAIKGLKAVQREARVATKTVAELGDVEAEKLYALIADRMKKKGKNPVCYLSGLRDYSTADLVNELSQREGVQSRWVSPYVNYDIRTWSEARGGVIEKGQGAAHILVVID